MKTNRLPFNPIADMTTVRGKKNERLALADEEIDAYLFSEYNNNLIELSQPEKREGGKTSEATPAIQAKRKPAKVTEIAPCHQRQNGKI